MIDPNNITKFDRTEAELEEFILFGVLVAGKNSNTQAKKLSEFLGNNESHPFLYIRQLDKMGILENSMKVYKLGQYARLSRCFRDLLKLKDRLSEVSFEELLQVYGLGYKTAKLFLVHTRRDYRGAVLDTHLMKYIRIVGGYDDAPDGTPPPKQYSKWEQVFLDLYDRHWGGVSVAEADLTIWKNARAGLYT